jgi:hypothetical protein
VDVKGDFSSYKLVQGEEMHEFGSENSERVLVNYCAANCEGDA